MRGDKDPESMGCDCCCCCWIDTRCDVEEGRGWAGGKAEADRSGGPFCGYNPGVGFKGTAEIE